MKLDVLKLQGKSMRLYKYIPPERIDVLKNLKIRFTQPVALNDPFESKPYYREVLSESSVEEIFEKQIVKAYEENPLARKIDFKSYRKRCLSQKDGLRKKFESVAMKKLDEIGRRLREELGFLSLAERKDNLLMWSHYSCNHQGFVLGLDFDDDFLSPKRDGGDKRNIEFGKVHYDDFRPSLNVEEMNARDIFFTKPKCWGYEEEWRLVRWLEFSGFSDNQGYPVALVDVPKSSIKDVFLGAKISRESKSSILSSLELSGLNDVNVFEMKFSEKEFALIPECFS